MAIDFLPVDFLHRIGEIVGDIFVGRPIDRDAKVVAVFGLETGLDVWTLEPVISEPIEVRELLVRQSIDLAVDIGGEIDTDEVLEIKSRASDASRARRVIPPILFECVCNWNPAKILS
jgi:hypothetical protein